MATLSSLDVELLSEEEEEDPNKSSKELSEDELSESSLSPGNLKNGTSFKLKTLYGKCHSALWGNYMHTGE